MRCAALKSENSNPFVFSFHAPSKMSLKPYRCFVIIIILAAWLVQSFARVQQLAGPEGEWMATEVGARPLLKRQSR